MNQDVSLAAIAQAAGLGVSHLKATFREATGMPVRQYVIRRRVEMAADLLARHGSSVAAVAHKTGFAHPSHLARQMRRVLGSSPRGIRQRLLG
ncbi:MAG TPA: helix-turn-helix transcriptional regulator [Bryobacteraceae bacterium]|nr:helix-turn-helix transcriptional regulator [Bryobacteraceae bacterium]